MRALAPSVAVAVAAGAAPAALGQDVEPMLGDQRPPEATVLDPAVPRPGRYHVNVGAALVGQYISRGIAFSDRPSWQPFVSLRVALPELAGGTLLGHAVTAVSVFAGSWNSLQAGGPGLGQRAQGPLSSWYESDLYTGAAVELDARWTVSAAYYRYESPGHSFAGYNDLELIVRLDDKDLWAFVALPRFTLSPALRVVQEAGRPGRADALYVQPSLSPTVALGEPAHALTLTVPLVAGFSDTYYQTAGGGHRAFGFFRTGAAIAGTPFPNAAPALSLTAGVDLWVLNGAVANGLDDVEAVGRVGASWGF